MKLLSANKRIASHAAMTTAAFVALSAWTAPAAQAAETSSNAGPKIVQVERPYDPLALDDQGNVWSAALNAISVKDGFYPKLMVKARRLDKVASLSGDLALKQDGTVWGIKRIYDVPLNEHVSAELGEQLPHLEHIVKILDAGAMGIAIDQDGKVWSFDVIPSGARKDDPAFQNYHIEPKLIQGLDHVKDMYVTGDSATFLKDDGSVWTIDYYVPVSRIHSDNPSIDDTIRSAKPVQLKELSDIVKLGDHAALKKDGTVWIWGRGLFAKPKDDGTENAVAPFQVKGLSDVADFSFSGQHALFVKKDGTVWEWGYFTQNWDNIGAKVPIVWKDLTKLQGVNDVAAVSASDYSKDLNVDALIKRDGTLWIWGVDPFWTFHQDPLQVDFKTSSN